MTVEWLVSAGTAFALVAAVGLPDKTFVATLVLATRYRPWPVWLGVAAAFAVQCVLAVAAGSLVSLLPTKPVRLVAAALFAAGAVVMVRGARKAGATGAEREREYQEKLRGRDAWSGGWRASGTSFLVLFTAEWVQENPAAVMTASAAQTTAPAYRMIDMRTLRTIQRPTSTAVPDTAASPPQAPSSTAAGGSPLATSPAVNSWDRSRAAVSLGRGRSTEPRACGDGR
jgi:putative Ca2+/H+ antiporter (TMEM165/GDT1 family)